MTDINQATDFGNNIDGFGGYVIGVENAGQIPIAPEDCFQIRNDEGEVVADCQGADVAKLYSHPNWDIDCFTCGIAKTYIDLADKYIDLISALLVLPIKVLFISLTSLWIVYSGIKFITGNNTSQKFFLEALFVVIAFGLLTSVHGAELVKTTYKVSLELMANLSLIAFEQQTIAAATSDEGDFVRMIRAAENGVGGVLKIGFKEFSDGKKYSPSTYVIPILLIVPYMFVIILYFAKVVVSIFRMMMLAIASPFLIMALGFPWGREIAKRGLMTAIAAIMVLFAASAAIGLLIFGVAETFSPADFEGADFSLVDPESTGAILTIIALGWLGTGLMHESISLANSLTGAFLNGSAAGVITRGIGASLALSSKPVRAAINPIASKVARVATPFLTGASS